MENIKKSIVESIAVKQAIVSDAALLERIEAAAQLCIESFRAGGKVLFCGNGGSAADAQHIAAELSGRFMRERAPLFAEALHVNTSFLTAVGNDYGFEHVYSRMVEAAGRPGDVLVAISTSGNSPNIAKAVKMALLKDMRVVVLTGKFGGQLAGISTVLINVPSTETPRIQEAHIMIGHIICEIIENQLFNE